MSSAPVSLVFFNDSSAIQLIILIQNTLKLELHLTPQQLSELLQSTSPIHNAFMHEYTSLQKQFQLTCEQLELEITRRKEAEEQLRRQTNAYEVLAEVAWHNGIDPVSQPFTPLSACSHVCILVVVPANLNHHGHCLGLCLSLIFLIITTMFAFQV